MAELLLVLMLAFNLWMVIYLTWERREDNKAEDGKGKDCEMKGMPDDIEGKSRFRMAERKPQAATMKQNAATDAQSDDEDEKDVTFADELKDTGNHATEKDVSRQVPDEDLDKVFEDNRTYAPDEDFDEEPPQAGGSSFDEIGRAARKVKDAKAKETEIPQAGKAFHEMEGHEF